MNSFKNYPNESRALFSPPYCALIISSFIDSYQKKSRKNFPPALLHFILPLVLNKEYPTVFLENKRKNFFHIVESNKQSFKTFKFNYHNLFEITNYALIFLAETNVLTTRENSLFLNLNIIDKKYLKLNFKSEFDKINAISNSISKIDDLTSIFITLGINP